MGRNKPGQSTRLLPIVLIALAALALAGAAIITLRPAAGAGGGAVALAGSAPVGTTAGGAPAPAANSPRTVQRTPVTAQGGVVRLAAAGLSDGVARFYTYRAGSKTISFFLLQGADGVLRAAFDACDVCYLARKGYRQEGDVMVCNNCGNRFPSVRINVETGGCNPAPLKAELQGDSVIIRVEDLEAGGRFF